MNGAEIMIRATLIEPQVMQGMWELQNRAHAMFNQMIVISPNLGPQVGADGGFFDVFGGQSMIVDHKGHILVKQPGMANGDSFVSTVIDIEALRRARIANGVTNWFKDLRTEQYAAIYEKPIYEKNRMDPIDPAASLTLDAKLLASFPEGYRHLAYLQSQIGYKIKTDMPGLKGDGVARLYASGAKWLKGEKLDR